MCVITRQFPLSAVGPCRWRAGAGRWHRHRSGHRPARVPRWHSRRSAQPCARINPNPSCDPAGAGQAAHRGRGAGGRAGAVHGAVARRRARLAPVLARRAAQPAGGGRRRCGARRARSGQRGATRRRGGAAGGGRAGVELGRRRERGEPRRPRRRGGRRRAAGACAARARWEGASPGLRPQVPGSVESWGVWLLRGAVGCDRAGRGREAGRAWRARLGPCLLAARARSSSRGAQRPCCCLRPCPACAARRNGAGAAAPGAQVRAAAQPAACPQYGSPARTPQCNTLRQGLLPVAERGGGGCRGGGSTPGGARRGRARRVRAGCALPGRQPRAAAFRGGRAAGRRAPPVRRTAARGRGWEAVCAVDERARCAPRARRAPCRMGGLPCMMARSRPAAACVPACSSWRSGRAVGRRAPGAQAILRSRDAGCSVPSCLLGCSPRAACVPRPARGCSNVLAVRLRARCYD